MPPDPGLVSRVADSLATMDERAVRQRNVFSGRGFLIGRSTFAIVWNDALLVKTTRAEYDSLLAAPGVAPFRPGGASAMGTWLVVPPETIADDPELAEWLRRGLRDIR
ncbi:MAG: TfoX protein [Gemmatimonadetes bacterium]|jgi:TfoX/Sxy family transcriptional regulator of competence genes|nr:TfoX protein [Gemmatimonadota bacterium]